MAVYIRNNYLTKIANIKMDKLMLVYAPTFCSYKEHLEMKTSSSNLKKYHII